MTVLRDAYSPKVVDSDDTTVKQSEIGPVQKALKIKEQMMADSILDSSTAKAKAETAKAEAQAAKAEAEAARAEAEVKKIAEGPAPVPTPAFQVKGSLNMGDIDMQEQAREQKEQAEAERIRKETELREEREKTEEAKRALHTAEQENLNQKIDRLEKTIMAGSASQKSIAAQITEIQESAGLLGYQKPDPALAGGVDIGMRIEIIKMQNENARAERQFKKDMRREEREFQRQLNRDADDRQFKSAEADRLAKRDEMFSKAPEMLGRAIASGMMEDGGAGSGSGKAAKKSYHIEVAEGEGGETECPYCQKPMAVGPTARTATCPSCEAKISVKRVATGPGEESGERDRRN